MEQDAHSTGKRFLSSLCVSYATSLTVFVLNKIYGSFSETIAGVPWGYVAGGVILGLALGAISVFLLSEKSSKIKKTAAMLPGLAGVLMTAAALVIFLNANSAPFYTTIITGENVYAEREALIPRDYNGLTLDIDGMYEGEFAIEFELKDTAAYDKLKVANMQLDGRINNSLFYHVKRGTFTIPGKFTRDSRLRINTLNAVTFNGELIVTLTGKK